MMLKKVRLGRFALGFAVTKRRAEGSLLVSVFVLDTARLKAASPRPVPHQP